MHKLILSFCLGFLMILNLTLLYLLETVICSLWQTLGEDWTSVMRHKYQEIWLRVQLRFDCSGKSRDNSYNVLFEICPFYLDISASEDFASNTKGWHTSTNDIVILIGVILKRLPKRKVNLPEVRLELISWLLWLLVCPNPFQLYLLPKSKM